ncbi:hypothetical protein BD408DRAFT_445197 [Parasitella parasitica]|nr:hypothetical protein BD408DRAFT_445197 [Parasitella parasitica]
METSPWCSLPLELWIVIFNQLKSTSELVNCRLVCSQWEHLVAEVVLEKDVEFSTHDAISSFNLFLTRKSDQVQRIKSIRIAKTDTLGLPLLRELLDLAMNPNVRTLDIRMCQNLFDHFMTIVERSPKKCNKLEALPELLTEVDHRYYSAMLYFKESLQKLEISNEMPANPVLKRLNEFSKLTQLTLNFHAMPDYFVELERILGKCCSLQILQFELVGTANQPIGKAAFKRWLLENIPQFHTLHTFELGEVDEPHIVEYVMHKYPQISKTVIGPFSSLNNGSANRILDAVKDVNLVELFMWQMQDMQEFNGLLPAMKSKTNQLKIQQNPYEPGSGVLFDVNKAVSDESTEFNINIDQNVPQSIFREIIRLVDSVNRLDINFLGCFDTNQEEEAVRFFELLEVVPEIESLKFTDTSIQLPSWQLNISVLDRLTSLEMCGAILDAGVLPTLGFLAPNLKELTLNTCFFGFHNRSFLVGLSHLGLEKLSIITNNSIFGNYTSGPIKERLEMIQSYISIAEFQSVLLTMCMSNQKTQYHVLIPGTPSHSEKISGADITQTVLSLPSILIICKSLKSLSIELGALVIEMNFGGTEEQMEEMSTDVYN